MVACHKKSVNGIWSAHNFDSKVSNSTEIAIHEGSITPPVYACGAPDVSPRIQQLLEPSPSNGECAYTFSSIMIFDPQSLGVLRGVMTERKSWWTNEEEDEYVTKEEVDLVGETANCHEDVDCHKFFMPIKIMDYSGMMEVVVDDQALLSNASCHNIGRLGFSLQEVMTQEWIPFPSQTHSPVAPGILPNPLCESTYAPPLHMPCYFGSSPNSSHVVSVLGQSSNRDMECHRSFSIGNEDNYNGLRNDQAHGTESLDCHVVGDDHNALKGVDLFLKNMGLKVCNREENEVLLSEYLDEPISSQNDNQKKVAKGKRELWNLAWEMKDGLQLECLERT